MKDGEKGQKYMDGSYTVEAALVFPIIVLILAAMLYMIFYLHDKYVIHVYANRMAQDCCWLYMENEHAREKLGSQEIIEMISQKYEPELKNQLLMTELTKSVGTCKKNLLTQLYTATWRLVGKPVLSVDVSSFHLFSPLSCEGEYARVHIRKWIYTREFKEALQGGE